ncbi:MAG: AMP-binding protein [Bacteroidota bacterium]|nr:AMP-binding protein [Bacteroidota bacterium]
MSKTFAPSSPEVIRRQSGEPYPFSGIWINGRHVYIEKILQEKESSRSPFEETTFRFIRDWLSGEEEFEMKTSGSTGPPKPITITRTQMIASATRTADRIKLQKNSTAFVCIDTKYIGGRMMLVRSLVLGLPIMAIDPCANPLIHIPVDKCVQFTAFVPYQLQTILESKHPHLLNGPDKILIGGAPLNAWTRAQLDRFECECYETYGMTETISHVALRLANTRLKQPYFEVMPGVEVTQDYRGCLVVSADYLPHEVVTNDMVELVAPGKFLWIGRWDSVINSGGVKVSPEKIEQQLATIFHEHGFQHRFFIAAIPDEKLTNKVVLIIEGVQFSSEILNKSLAALQSAVSRYELPREVYTSLYFVTTETQKIDRNQTLAGVTFHSSLK